LIVLAGAAWWAWGSVQAVARGETVIGAHDDLGGARVQQQVAGRRSAARI
jgi:hypothetical protein